MKRAAKLLLLILAGFMIRPTFYASADGGSCLYQCEGPMCANFGNSSTLCVETRARCQAKCSQPGGGNDAKVWGAIAYSAKDKGKGWSYGWTDVEKAKRLALENCAKNGVACKLWVYFANECGAIAADGDFVAWGTSSSRATAEQRAVLECTKEGGKHCAAQSSVCSR